MASYISVPRDLTKVKSKIMFNLTKRQLICFSVAALIGVPSFFLLKSIGNSSMAAMGMMVIMMPLFFLAMYEKNGQTLEVFLGHFIEANFRRPKQRPYKTNNYYSALMKQAQIEMEVEKIVGSNKQNVSEEQTRNCDTGVFNKRGAKTTSTACKKSEKK